jgi:hypothetical protein
VAGSSLYAVLVTLCFAWILWFLFNLIPRVCLMLQIVRLHWSAQDEPPMPGRWDSGGSPFSFPQGLRRLRQRKRAPRVRS